MKKETYYVEEHEQYEVASQEEYEEAMKEVKANCAKTLRAYCKKLWKDAEIDDAEIDYTEKDEVFPGRGRVDAFVSIDGHDDYERYDNMLEGYRAIFGETNQIERRPLLKYHTHLIYIDIDEKLEEIDIWCISDVIEDVSEED